MSTVATTPIPDCPASIDGCPGPECPIDCDRREIAAGLQAATDNVLDISYSGNTCFLGEDETTKGHLYDAHLHIVDDDDYIFLDDRGPESLEVQLVKKLRDLARFYANLAEKAKANLAARQEGKV